MSEHKKFNYKNLSEIKKAIQDLNINMELDEDLSPLAKPVAVGSKTAPNAIAVLPMEGCDLLPDGSPSELVKRRYIRFAAGGAGLLWWEANAVVQEGKANPNQMMLTRENLSSFQKLMKQVTMAAKDKNGEEHQPLHILQLTHSGRYSRPNGHKPIPLIAQHDSILDARMGLDENFSVVSDAYLDALIEKYVESAVLAREAGFDGVDIKACHRYLVSELLAGHTRKGKYGGSFENRSRFLIETIKAVKKELGNDFIVASRFNVFDAHPFPYGFGCNQEDFWQFDETEPLMLVRKMCEAGVDLLSNSAGNPYYIYPQVTRPFDQSSMGVPIPQEHPLESIERLFYFTRLVQQEAGKVPVVGNGYTWLREFIPYAAAANVKNHSCSFVGLGRSSFAYPEAPYDIFNEGMMKPEKCCITCSKCTQIMRDHGMTGCVIKDSGVYVPLYKSARNDAIAREQ